MGKSARVEDSGADRELVAAAKNGNEAAVRTIIRTHNRMLFRLARSILPTDDDAEDAVQAAYVHAFTALANFRGESSLRTWLGRIVLNEALGRARRTRPSIELAALEHLSTAEVIPFPRAVELANPEYNMARYEIRRVIEEAIDELPVAFRTVLVARLVEELSVEETADLLGLRAETVKTRLYRARALLRTARERCCGGPWNGSSAESGTRSSNSAESVASGSPIASSPPCGTAADRGNLFDASASNGRNHAWRKQMFGRAFRAVFAVVIIVPGLAAAQPAKLTDPQIAHIAYTADEIDIKAAQQALQKSKSPQVREFAQDMVRDHKAVNDKALALVKKLNVTPQANDTSKALVKQADEERNKLAKLSGAAFDRAYAQNEVSYHQTVNNALQTTLIPSASNPELKDLLSNGLKIFQGHEEHAKQVVAALQ